MTGIDITELAQSLKASAEKATPGSWGAFQYHDGRCGVGGGHKFEIMVCEHISKERPQDAAFIALANPDNIRALVEALEKAQRMEDYWKSQCRGITDHSEKLQAQIEKWETLNAQFCSNADADISALRQRITELESRTVTVRLPDISSKAFWSGNGKTEVFHPETYKRWVKEAIERHCAIARIDVEVK
jgi:hypothetical protein